MAEMILYDKLVSLDSQKHGDLRIKPLDGYAYAAKADSVPVVGVEFVDAAREYPVAFVRADADAFLPVVLFGLRNGENLFVSESGAWDGRYVPAFVRRYPFIPADVGQGQTVICMDEAAPCFSREEGDPLFEGDKPGRLLQNMMNLMQDYQTQALRTQEFCKRLRDYNLLVESNAQANLPDGSSFRMSGLFVVDEKRLQVLDKDKVHGLFANGELGLIYAHLMSLGNLQRLVEKLSQKLAA